MDFSDILDGIARPAKGDDAPYRGSGSIASPEFWQVLDQIADAPPLHDERLRQAYFAEGYVAARTGWELSEPILETEELSLDPGDIAFELDLASVASSEELSSLRRKFAMLNHPDRRPPEMRDRANRRMTIANALIDQAATRFSR